ncbi:MAG: Rrf2 family transcriptional regulator [Planctomycetes bacterium]|nr:Rrf2 family transcriptional regulator [Planctomycetota bacterium]
MSNFIKLSDAASIAIHSVIVLAIEPDKVRSNKEIARTLNISVDHLSKVLQRLNKAGFVESVRGPKGGFRLGKPRDDINLYEIYEVIDGELPIHPCLFSNQICRLPSCLFRDFFSKMRQQIKDYFTTTQLSTIIDSNSNLISELKKGFINKPNKEKGI